MSDAKGSDQELKQLENKLKNLEEESQKIKQLQKQLEQEMQSVGADKPEVDSRSVYVGSVDYGATVEELQQFFSECGTVNRVTILCDKFTGHPKGFAYIEFLEKDSVAAAVRLKNDATFRNRQLKVIAKRTNLPGVSRGRGGFRGRARGRGFRGRGRGYNPY